MRQRVFGFLKPKEERSPARVGWIGARQRHCREQRGSVSGLIQHVVGLYKNAPIYRDFVIRLYAAAARCSTLRGTHAARSGKYYRAWRLGYYPPSGPRPERDAPTGPQLYCRGRSRRTQRGEWCYRAMVSVDLQRRSSASKAAL